MKKAIYSLVLVIMVIGLVVSCAAPAPAPAPVPAPPPEPIELTLVTFMPTYISSVRAGLQVVERINEPTDRDLSTRKFLSYKDFPLLMELR